jgi:DNA-binding beta-propeller fold protein YncE
VNATTVTDTLPPVGVHHRAAPVVATIVVAVGLVAAANPAAGRTLPLERVRDVGLSGRSSRFDYQSIDAPGRRLYVAHLGDSALEVIDLDALAVVATVPEIADVHGVLAVPEIGRVFASATRTNALVTVDASTNQVVARTPTGKFPDGVRMVRTVQLGHEGLYVQPQTQQAFVACENNAEVVMVDLRNTDRSPRRPSATTRTCSPTSPASDVSTSPPKAAS